MDLTVAMALEEDFNGVMDIASWGSEEFCRNCITYTRGFGCRLRDGSLKMESVKRTTGAGCDPREGWNLYHIYLHICLCWTVVLAHQYYTFFFPRSSFTCHLVLKESLFPSSWSICMRHVVTPKRKTWSCKCRLGRCGFAGPLQTNSQFRPYRPTEQKPNKLRNVRRRARCKGLYEIES